MLIQGTSISVTYRRIEGIKKAYYNHEDLLKKYFNDATVLPVPDDAPVDIPRIIIKTLHEHAQLNISPTAATFVVQYNEGYEKNWELASQYIQERMSSVFSFLNILTENQYEYIGVVSNIIYDDIMENGAERIVKTLLNSDKIRNIHDINIKYTFVENDHIFVNIMLQNARLFKDGVIDDIAGELNDKNQTAESIGAIIDINDRYGFNNCPSYHSDSEKLMEILSSMGNVINHKLKTLIEEGAY